MRRKTVNRGGRWLRTTTATRAKFPLPQRAPDGGYVFSVRCAQRIIRSAAVPPVPAAATSTGPGVKGLPRLASLSSIAAPETGALRPVPAAAACEMFRLNGKIPAATLNTYLGLPRVGTRTQRSRCTSKTSKLQPGATPKSKAPKSYPKRQRGGPISGSHGASPQAQASGHAGKTVARSRLLSAHFSPSPGLLGERAGVRAGISVHLTSMNRPIQGAESRVLRLI